MTLHVYPGASGSFILYDDEGDSYRYEKGAFTETKLVGDDCSRTLTIGPRQGVYDGMTQSQTYRVVLGNNEKTITVEGSDTATVTF